MESGKVVLVTGGTGELGRVVVQRALQQGHDVSVVYRSVEEWTRLAASVPEERLLGLPGDASSPDFMERAVEATVERFDRLDGLFHLVGGYAYASLQDTSLDLWERVVSLNLTTAFVAARSALPALRASRGAIAFVAAQAALTTPANQAAYNASKAGVLALAQTLSKELRSSGIRVNSVVPDIIDTPANRRAMPNANVDRWLTPDQIAKTLMYLVSDAATGVSGATISMQRS